MTDRECQWDDAPEKPVTIPRPIPCRIEWVGPEGWVVFADEDGVHLRAPRGGALEMADVARLFELWQGARDAVSISRIPAPQPPTREEIRAMGSFRAEEHVKRRAMRAINAEFGDSDTAPF